MTLDDLKRVGGMCATALDDSGHFATSAVLVGEDGEGIAIARADLPTFLDGLREACIDDHQRTRLDEKIELCRALPANKIPVIIFCPAGVLVRTATSRRIS